MPAGEILKVCAVLALRACRAVLEACVGPNEPEIHFEISKGKIACTVQSRTCGAGTVRSALRTRVIIIVLFFFLFRYHLSNLKRLYSPIRVYTYFFFFNGPSVYRRIDRTKVSLVFVKPKEYSDRNEKDTTCKSTKRN